MQANGHHHLNVRKRVYKKLESYPHPDAFKRSLDRLMVFIAIAGPVATLPQVIDVFATRDVSGLSFTTWFLWLILSIVWICYGYIHKEMPIFIANVAYLVLNGIVVAAILAYR